MDKVYIPINNSNEFKLSYIDYCGPIYKIFYEDSKNKLYRIDVYYDPIEKFSDVDEYHNYISTKNKNVKQQNANVNIKSEIKKMGDRKYLDYLETDYIEPGGILKTHEVTLVENGAVIKYIQLSANDEMFYQFFEEVTLVSAKEYKAIK